MVYGQHLTGQQAAARLGISRSTLWRDIQAACEAFDAQQVVPPITDDGLMALAVAVLLRAWYDATRQSGELAREARRWLAEDEWAQQLLDLCGISRQRMIERLQEIVAGVPD
jgi:sugar (pentulose or hexulose) kinase